MSDEISPPGRRIKYVEFLDFLIEKKVKPDCPSCGSDSAFVSADDDTTFAAQTRGDVVQFNPKTSELLRKSDTSILALSTVCANCGLIRSYASHTVLEWLNEQQDPSS